jgi:hypothetical protein
MTAQNQLPSLDPAGVIGIYQLPSLPVWQSIQRPSSPFLKYLQNRV